MEQYSGFNTLVQVDDAFVWTFFVATTESLKTRVDTFGTEPMITEFFQLAQVGLVVGVHSRVRLKNIVQGKSSTYCWDCTAGWRD